MIGLRNTALGLVLAYAATTGTVWAQSTAPVAPTQKTETVRKQTEGLLPPAEALEQKDSELAPDAYQPQGIELGSFFLLPKFEVGATHDSNIYKNNYDAKSDTITSYRPEFTLNSRFDQHSLNAVAWAERKIYSRHSREDVTNAYANINGQYDVSKDVNLSGYVSYTRDHEDRGSPDDAGGLHPTRFQYFSSSLAGNVKTGRLNSTLSFGATRREWEDTATSTGITPSHLRDRNEYEILVREAYEIFPSYSLIGQGQYLMRRYLNDRDQTGYDRDSDGIRLATGIGVDISDLVRGDFLVGYYQQNYSDNRLQEPSGTYFKAQFNWTPTKLTTVIPTLERTVEETTAAQVAALIHTGGSVMVRHELQRNLILSTTLGYSLDEQVGGPLETQMFDGTLRGTYLFNRNLYTSLELQQKHKLSNLDGQGFNQTAGMLRLGVQY